jgi:hypothetical protein
MYRLRWSTIITFLAGRNLSERFLQSKIKGFLAAGKVRGDYLNEGNVSV